MVSKVCAQAVLPYVYLKHMSFYMKNQVSLFIVEQVEMIGWYRKLWSYAFLWLLVSCTWSLVNIAFKLATFLMTSRFDHVVQLRNFWISRSTGLFTRWLTHFPQINIGAICNSKGTYYSHVNSQHQKSIILIKLFWFYVHIILL